MTTPEPVEAVFIWRQRVGGGLRDIPITITWQPGTDGDGEDHWVPVKFVIDGLGQRLGPKALEKAPLAYAIATTDPGNVNADPVVAAVHRRPRKPKQETPTVPAGAKFTPLELVEEVLGLRAYNALRRSGVATLEQAMAMTDDQLRELDGVGEKSVALIRAALNQFQMVAVPLGWPGMRSVQA